MRLIISRFLLQALLDYLHADLDMSAYWARLNAEGVTKERLASYDRPIVSEPNLKLEQKEGLIRDLGNYLKTLKAVHSGADLESAAASVLGYKLDAMKVSAATWSPLVQNESRDKSHDCLRQLHLQDDRCVCPGESSEIPDIYRVSPGCACVADSPFLPWPFSGGWLRLCSLLL